MSEGWTGGQGGSRISEPREVVLAAWMSVRQLRWRGVGGLGAPVLGTEGEESAMKECQVDGDPILR